jgi:ribosomal subunit interface protein
MCMITYTLTGDNVAIDDALRAYIEKRFKKFDRFAKTEAQDITVTVSKVTAYQREDSFKVEVKFKLGQNDFFVTGESGDVMRAVDTAKEELWREVTSSKGRKDTLFYRGARNVKNSIKSGVGYFRRKK